MISTDSPGHGEPEFQRLKMMSDAGDPKTQFANYPSLKGRSVLITGGASGIGASLVAEFARQGSRVAFFDIQDEAGNALAESLAAEGCPLPLFIHCDLIDLNALKSAIERTTAAQGAVDVLVNNAANDQR